MSFNPRSDVVMGVIEAADPFRAQAATERLQALGAGAPSEAFAADLDRATNIAGQAHGLGDARAALAGRSPDAASRAKVGFEAMLINSLVGEMLPKDADAVFGQGTAGNIWRSMLSEQISQQIARSGALGLSRRLFATHDIAPRATSQGFGAATKSTLASTNSLSSSDAAEITNGAVLFPGRKGA